MRNAFLILLAFSALASPAAYAAVSAKGDGTLSVRDGSGKVTLVGRISTFGRVESGRIVFTSLDPADDTFPDFFDTCERTQLRTDGGILCIGTKLRFRLIDAKYRVTIIGRGIDVTAIGKAQATLQGAELSLDDGDFSLNGGLYKAIPADLLAVTFGQPPPPPAPSVTP